MIISLDQKFIEITMEQLTGSWPVNISWDKNFTILSPINRATLNLSEEKLRKLPISDTRV